MADNVKGIATPSKDGDRNHVYWEPHDSYQQAGHVIFHEVGHIFGLLELYDPFPVSSDDTVMGYQYSDNDYAFFPGYTQSDVIALSALW